MKIPEDVKVSGFTYKVIRTDESFAVGSDVCDGIHCFSDQLIKVSNHGDVAYQQFVFLHELSHAILECYCPKFNCEEVSESLAKGLYQVIIDNPEIFNSDEDYKVNCSGGKI